MPALFDRYVIVDWSAANQKTTGRNSIWICDKGPRGESFENPETRHRAKLRLNEILAAAANDGERVLLGFDFPFGYPAGFAARLGLRNACWRAVWDEIAGLLEDGPTNRSNRFNVGAEFNRRISGAAFPFWGCPTRFADAFLGPKKPLRDAAEHLAEKRLIDEYMRGAQPCWKLAYPGSVGSQALTGIPVVSELRDDPRWRDCAQIWPFETGLRLPRDARIVFAEVWPSWWRVRPEFGPPNDKAQVRTVAALFSAEDQAGRLAALFCGDPNLTDEQRSIVVNEEAWTLGVTAPRSSEGRKLPNDSYPLPSRRKPGSAPAGRQPSQRGALSGQHGAPRAARQWPPAFTEVMREEGAAGFPCALEAGELAEVPCYAYVRDPDEIRRRSFALIRKEADLGRFPPELRPLGLRLAHAAGDTAILAALAWSRGAVAAGRKALAAGATILVDSEMVAAGIARDRLRAANPILCTLHAPETKELAMALGTTRSAAAVELWREALAGAIVAIGNAPTALFHLLELIAAGKRAPALVLGFPVGFVGAAEAKQALAEFGRDLGYITLKGRRGGSALAAAAVNALAEAAA